MLTNPHLHETVEAAAQAAEEAVDGPVVAAAGDGSNHTYTKRILLLLVGGFFLVAAMLFTPHKESRVLEAVPNNAALVLLLPPNTQAVAHLKRILPLPTEPSPYEVAVVVLRNPLSIGLVASLPEPRDLLSLTTPEGWVVAPLGKRLAAIGSPTFTNQLDGTLPLPWWTRAKAHNRAKRSSGALLWGADPAAPWLVGQLMATEDALGASVPLLTKPNAGLGSLEPGIQTLLQTLTPLLTPSRTSLKLPDGTIARELRTDTPTPHWSVTPPTLTLNQGEKTLISYTHAETSPSPCPQGGQAPTLVFSIPNILKIDTFSVSLLKQAVSLCMTNVDSL